MSQAHKGKNGNDCSSLNKTDIRYWYTYLFFLLLFSLFLKVYEIFSELLWNRVKKFLSFGTNFVDHIIIFHHSKILEKEWMSYIPYLFSIPGICQNLCKNLLFIEQMTILQFVFLLYLLGFLIVWSHF